MKRYSTKSPLFVEDAYKISHILQYPENVSGVYANFTPRKSRVPGVDHVVVFGVQYAVAVIDSIFNNDFFSYSEGEAVGDFIEFYTKFFGGSPSEDLVLVVRKLHNYGCLPIKIKALPEGTLCPIGVPFMTVKTTEPELKWVGCHIESLLSALVWHPVTSATIANEYRRVFEDYANRTSDLAFMPDYQGHDFSFRGQTSPWSASVSGAAHLLSFRGTDTMPACSFVDVYYPITREGEYTLGTSVPATEHSVAQAGGQVNESEYLERMLDLYPSGIFSIVADTWDFWAFVTELLPKYKDRIAARDGKVVIRPDSSPKTPVEIIVGDPEATPGTPEYKGLAECLYEVFGGVTNSKGYIELQSVGMIYGDSITPEYQKAILEGLRMKGFSSTNVVLGIGSYTYQYVTRDTFGMAFKETAVKINGKWVATWKDPKTDTSGKRSARGLLKVDRNEHGVITLYQNVTEQEEDEGMLRTVYANSEFLVEEGFDVIRKRLGWINE